jgi:hypothetical protein|tara:strand:+ start:2410 stop:3081 length:672 start_codon:yes stop_codon:yes gene_type:complete
MTYTADITGFPYWKNNAVKVERNSWDKVAKDLMRLSGLKQDLEKSVGKTEDWLDEEMLKNEKLIKEKKSLKKENKFYLKKIEKIKKKNKEEWESGTEKIGQQLSDALEENKKLKEEIKKLKKEHIQNIMKTKSIATELYREMKYSLGYGEFDEPDRKVMYDDIKKLKEEIKELKEMSRDKVRQLVEEYFYGERVSRNPEVSTSYTIYDWDSGEESESEEEDKS